MSDAPTAAPAAAPTAPKKKTKMKLIVIGLVAVALGVGGGVYAMRRPAASGETKEVEVSKGLVPFDPFVVNLADPGGTRFVRLTLNLVVNEEKAASEIVNNQVQMKEARSGILELLAQQTAGGLATPEGKQALKKTIIERVGPIFKQAKVIDVYFSEFVVQF